MWDTTGCGDVHMGKQKGQASNAAPARAVPMTVLGKTLAVQRTRLGGVLLNGCLLPAQEWQSSNFDMCIYESGCYAPYKHIRQNSSVAAAGPNRSDQRVAPHARAPLGAGGLAAAPLACCRKLAGRLRPPPPLVPVAVAGMVLVAPCVLPSCVCISTVPVVVLGAGCPAPSSSLSSREMEFSACMHSGWQQPLTCKPHTCM